MYLVCLKEIIFFIKFVYAFPLNLSLLNRILPLRYPNKDPYILLNLFSFFPSIQTQGVDDPFGNDTKLWKWQYKFSRRTLDSNNVFKNRWWTIEMMVFVS